MKKVRVNFCDFWNSFNPADNFIVRALAGQYDLEISEKPDFLFYSCFGHDHIKYDCVKIFYTGECQTPDFNICDYAIGFDRIDFSDRYFRYPFYLLQESNCRRMEAKHNLSPDSRPSFCSFVYSNHRASDSRDSFFALLSQYKKVDSGGLHLNNVGGAVKDKYEFLKSHKFDMAFENASYPGYTTEKIVDAFAAGTIPIYWGDPDICSTFNPDAFINCADYPSVDAVIEKIKQIDCDDSLYAKMLKTPALMNSSDSYDAMTAGLTAFLSSILGRDPTGTFRRNRGFWGRNYQNQLYRKPGIFKTLYKKTLWRWKQKGGLLRKLDFSFRR